MHQMRVRIITAPAFTGAKVIGAILFEGTTDGEVRGKPTSAFMSEERGVDPFVKVDKGLQPEKDGVQLMRPMPELDALARSRAALGIEGAPSLPNLRDAHGANLATHRARDGLPSISSALVSASTG